MRTIKFRAWDCIEKKMWLPEDPEFQNNFHLYPAGNYSFHQSFMDESFILMQDTGLFDKDGKKIYDGDVLKNSFERTTISILWDITGARWSLQELNIPFDDGVGRGNWDFVMGIAKNCEIIGNIYENHELLNCASTPKEGK